MPSEDLEPAVPLRRILGVNFYCGSLEETVRRGLQGGLVVVPSAPVLVNAARDPATRAALLESDLAVTDSGLMVLYWNLTRGTKLARVSGLAYLQRLLEEPTLKEAGALFWVMPNEQSVASTRRWLGGRGFAVAQDDFYLAPLYPKGPLTDTALLAAIEKRRPRHVIMAIGGNVQERLGHYLIRHLSYRPGIHGTGAAIGFLNGDQAHIPGWADRFFLGWLMRCLRAPRTFIPRYWQARELVTLLWRFGESMPRLDLDESSPPRATKSLRP